MLSINSNVWSHESHKSGKKCSLKEVHASPARKIKSFQDLVRAVADISYHNPEQVLFFRGQGREYRKKTSEGLLINSFYPSIYRSPGKRLSSTDLEERFELLSELSDKLLEKFKTHNVHGHDKLAKFDELLWAILQHYEVCSTPFLDVTHSLRVAASFALNSKSETGYLFAFGFPHPNGSITYSVESELLNIRLLSICPPEAQRPYFQEGFLVGTFPSFRVRRHPNLDIGVRLIAKFELIGANFWDENFHAIPSNALFPKNDRLHEVCMELKSEYGL